MTVSTIFADDGGHFAGIVRWRFGMKKFLRLVRESLAQRLDIGSDEAVRVECVDAESGIEDHELRRCFLSAIQEGHEEAALHPVPIWMQRAVRHATDLLEGRVRRRWQMQSTQERMPIARNPTGGRDNEERGLAYSVPKTPAHYQTLNQQRNEWTRWRQE